VFLNPCPKGDGTSILLEVMTIQMDMFCNLLDCYFNKPRWLDDVALNVPVIPCIPPCP